jgi:hypothetical protein
VDPVDLDDDHVLFLVRTLHVGADLWRAAAQFVFPWPFSPSRTVARGEGTTSTAARFRKSWTWSERRRNGRPET